jgi:gluconate 2-dehydrogenase gamma chain
MEPDALLEPPDRPITRRRFLALSAAAAGALALGAEAAGCTNTTQSTSSSAAAGTTQTSAAGSTATTMSAMTQNQRFAQPLHILSAAQAALLAAVVDRLIPADNLGPSASQAGVVGYIDGALNQETDRGATFLGNLDAIESLAEQAGAQSPGNTQTTGSTQTTAGMQSGSGAQAQGGFASLAADQQDAILGAIQGGKAAGFTPDSTVFFLTLREYTLEGMFADPYYGGNRGFAGWHLIGFPGIRLTVPASEQQLDVKPQTVDKSVYDYGEFGFAVQGG